MKQLVFVHGRAQEHKDAAALKAEWVDAWRSGLAKNGLSMPIAETDIRFPYYGQTLYDLAQGKTASEAAAVIVKGDNADAEQRAFIREVLLEVQRRQGISDAELAEVAGAEVVQKGPLNWEWLQAVLKVIDRRVPLASGTSIALATNDVYQYLDNIGIRDEIETGVHQALKPNVQTVVAAHSLGTVVAYNLLRREGAAQGWQVPLFITLGAPLAVKAIRKKLAPNRHPACVGRWFNALDERDVVALYRLDADHFPLDPQITNKHDVDNPTPNRHGISGYLSDSEVAKAMHDALVA
ncbi:MAG TPA: alpha/beta hydrolase [Thermoanaerobaculia bacterium]|nr:alpha/beta hydrolase [Thermoanaerobaculia bacterium]